LGEIPNAKMLLMAYRLGLQQQPLTGTFFLVDFNLEDDIPAQHHQDVACISVVKSKKAESRTMDYLIRRLDDTLKDYQQLFSRP
jgi:hypothetical protein